MAVARNTGDHRALPMPYAIDRVSVSGIFSGSSPPLTVSPTSTMVTITASLVVCEPIALHI